MFRKAPDFPDWEAQQPPVKFHAVLTRERYLSDASTMAKGPFHTPESRGVCRQRTLIAQWTCGRHYDNIRRYARGKHAAFRMMDGL